MRTLVRTLCRVIEMFVLIIVVLSLFVFDAEFDSDSLSVVVLFRYINEHDGEILTSFLA